MLKRFLNPVTVLALLAWGGVAAAQSTDVLSAIDPTSWGKSPFYFGGFILLAIAAIKRAAEQEQFKKYGQITGNPWLWRGLAVVLGIGGAFGLSIANFGAELVLFGLVSPWTIVLFGLASSIVAMGGRDLLKQALGWIGGPNLPGAPVDATLTAPTEPAPPSGFEPLNLTVPGSTQGLMSVASFPGMGGPLVEAGLSALLTWVLTQLHLPPTAENIARLALKLGKVLPDLAFDGDAHLSWRNRAAILDVAEELKAMGGLK
ncbi:hypothetical protein QR90_06860 [Deinococcus radiopugnans]|uniref:Uncharacterized protein n=1 Tax=Deinococcus radiopugnans TaxID=57497 RepID=A0A0A7KK34_9DEIO|nr:hypothetical protein [Deinococcus radiopugnans]AIZ44888.1 hypothetical protein QR90_06860 [Deinococcus radiopugnans]QLG10976.1 hypothetical protein HLB42_09485 [Deinococcus sp. D7000]